MSKNICVLGQGAWGSALAHVARKSGHAVTTWARGQAPVPPNLDAVILAVPAQSVRDVMIQAGIKSGPVIIAAKGIERSTGKLMAEVVRECAPLATPLCLSGPSFASDVLQGLPTAVTMAADNLDLAANWAALLSQPNFRIYHSDDLIGVEIGGACKNVLAIACGISDGLGLGESAKAALITRSFSELSKLANAMGGKSRTLMGLSGLGDLLLTASSPQSRNRTFGFAIGQGTTVAAALASSKGVVEGAATAAVAKQLGQIFKIELPIVNAVASIIDENRSPRDVVRELLARPAQME